MCRVVAGVMPGCSFDVTPDDLPNADFERHTHAAGPMRARWRFSLCAKCRNGWLGPGVEALPQSDRARVRMWCHDE
ncbi:hypothetical protein [Streptomyces cupreus]|uniref:Uncharacterized protein n=1 Tax=Streptomyces cupreus TaxID=2759956 RepID=A0A7X1J1F0_9ACTN|nr:hypothetical protein [Streptomyces cupreus]MBC2902445.1 hypothetical protein [Streptomyces cupreus]